MASKRATRKKLPPILAKPMKPPAQLPWESEAEFQKRASDEIWEARKQKLPELMKYYDITHSGDVTGTLLYLLIAVASDHIRGFQVGRGRGAPIKANKGDRELYRRVREMRYSRMQKETDKPLSVLAACKLLTKHGQPYARENVDALRKRYERAEKAWGKIEQLNAMMRLLKDVPTHLLLSALPLRDNNSA